MIKSRIKEPSRPLFLGIEGGATHTVAILAEAHGKLVQQFETGPANIKLLSESQLLSLLKNIAKAFPAPDAVGVGMAGARDESDWNRILAAAKKIWPATPCQATNDLETALAAPEQKIGETPAARVLILSGTGSCCYGRAGGKIAKVGGWGHVLGDKGSGYEIGLRALKAVVYYYDREDSWSRLGAQLLHRLQLNEPNQLVSWAQSAEKSQIAGLATEVFDAWKRKDKIAIDILTGAENSLAKDGLACAAKLARPNQPVQFILAGSILLKQPAFSKAIGKHLKKHWPKCIVTNLQRGSVWGAVNLAKKIWQERQPQLKSAKPITKKKVVEKPALMPEFPLADLVKKSPTEQRNPLSFNIDKISTIAAVELMLSEDAKIPTAILKEKAQIAQAVKLITHAFKSGGRLFYIGAGTSGRLGVLDASECPPTFRTSPELVQGIIAGGQGALWRSVEGAEDDPLAGAKAIEFRNLTKKDVLVGIAASGRTPYVWGALGEARKRGAKTVLVAFNPFLNIGKAARPDVVITPNVGPELLTGSTRLKSGTATKLILNVFTTLAMVGIGKVISNLMIDLNPSNIKLRDRAIRIIRELRDVDYATAEKALQRSKWIIKDACRQLPENKNFRSAPAKR